MVKIERFAVERWMDDNENDAKYNLAETCCASISLNDLIALSGEVPDSRSMLDFSRKQTYGPIRGSDALRSSIARLYSRETAASPLPLQNILVTNGAIQANFLALYACVGAGDHVICQYPTYQQLYAVPESLGAQVSLWKSRPDDGWHLDLDDLQALIRPRTKLIIINNPQNPTGAVLSRELLQGIVDIARQHGIAIHSDEVYRPLFHSVNEADHPPSILSFGYEKTTASGSMSKAFSLAGIRLGWIASRSVEITEACAAARDYTTISVSQLDDQVATFALSEPAVHNLLLRNMETARANLAILEAFVKQFDWACTWVRPVAGTTAFIKFVDRNGRTVDDVQFCQRLQARTGVLLAPGSQCFGGGVDFKGFVRFGYVPEPRVLIEGLQALGQFMDGEYGDLPVV